ncbi:HoxN/HupN/NixA family nickel/cobalt transporter [Acerihabitans sp. TG2]|uniref:HoxN/HupN/NixA family nickel/cobalt transporter n=1 Tax=Acerihabitans sp. TG2 TaxID=3096008 RepID=UPI002B23E952|nr:HoxN/HupN/NixA family nickel/cobalt transporter [Acerihabitans sp. TG2]MEA9390097.1 HoxN/HupN/NixA family nickel/cobalt transporter [Acerihabitans sp. TG2]
MANPTLSSSKCQAIFLMFFLVSVNVIAWVWAWVVFAHNATLTGAALLAYSYGLRHAVDADHIAAIDNVTRKLMQQGQRPISVGAFFSLGHSTIVLLACAAIAATSLAFKNQMGWIHDYGGIIGTLVSAVFLLIVALVNLMILHTVYKKFRQIKRGGAVNDQHIDDLPASNGGLMTRIFRFAFKFVNKSWQMYLVGFLFGLGFDTATEVGLLGISAAGASSGLSVWSIMVFPVLFASGMALIDSLDNFVMVGAYGWAFAKPVRKLYYNMTITATSVVIALFIGGLETLGLITDEFSLQGRFWHMIGYLNTHMGQVGYWVIGLFVFFWLVSALNYRWRNYDSIMVN